MRHCLYLFFCMRETMLWRKNERSRIKTVLMNILGGLLVIIRMNKVPNERIREFCRVLKGDG